MTKPGMAGEATLDEILASIRKVLDKEGAAGRGADDNVFAALAPTPTPAQSLTAPVRNAPRPYAEPAAERSPLMDRIARVVGNNTNTAGGAAPPQSANGALEQFIESDLGDLLADAPAAASKPAAQPAPAPQPAAPAPLWPSVTAATPLPAAPNGAAPAAAVRSEPSFAALSEPPSTPHDIKPVSAPDSLGNLIPSRLDTQHGTQSVASRLPPLSGPGELPAFAKLRPGAPDIKPMPPFPAPPAGDAGKDRLAAASWSDMMRRAEDAAGAAEPAVSATPAPPAAEPVVLAAMGVPRKPAVAQPPVSQTFPPVETAAPRPAEMKPQAPAEPPVSEPAASEPVILAAMAPKAAPAAPKPARPSLESEPFPAASRDGLQTISRIDPPAAAAAEVASKPPVGVGAAPASAGIAAAEADTNAAVASALGALAAGLAASSAKPAAATQAKPAEPVAAQPAAAKSQQPDLVKGLSMAAAARPEALPVAEVLASTHAASPLPPVGTTAAPLPKLKAEPEIAATASSPVATPVTAAIPVAPDATQPSEAFLALASTQSAPRAMLPSVIGQHGMFEPESPLDDTVAELLRPMLRQWLADNMPRIVEKALRIELAESLKKDH